MLSNATKGFSILLSLFILSGCRAGRGCSDIQKSAAIVILEVIQPFAQDNHLATVKIHKITDCKIEGSCKIIPLNQEFLANFVYTHKYTGANNNFKALREHLPGVKTGSVIEAYITTERRKHGQLMTRIYEYKLIK
ncbi:MAG: hypothetical protein ACK4KT_08905 [Thermaurantimonas sp.]